MAKGFELAIELAGGVTALATLLGKTPQCVSNWRVRGVPVAECPSIERLPEMRGRVTCKDLRADVFFAPTKSARPTTASDAVAQRNLPERGA